MRAWEHGYVQLLYAVQSYRTVRIRMYQYASDLIILHHLPQLCINVANEQLQHHFNEHIFRWEQEECAKEGVTMETISYCSNWPVVDLFLEVLCVTAFVV